MPNRSVFLHAWLRRAVRRLKGSRTWDRMVTIAGTFAGILVLLQREEPPRIRRTELVLPVLRGQPITIAHLSDLHLGTAVARRRLAAAAGMLTSSGCDLVAITGDCVTGRLSRLDAACLRHCLAALSRQVPVLACLGNHDGGPRARSHGGMASPEAVLHALTAAGCRVLRNERIDLAVAGNTISIIGLDELKEGRCHPEALPWPHDQRAVVVLVHNPGARSHIADRPWQVLLCGHTHGGQVRLPLIGAPWIPPVDSGPGAGHDRWRGRHVVISAGLGSIHDLRIGCPAELGLITLRPPREVREPPAP